MATTAKQRFDQVMERCWNLLHETDTNKIEKSVCDDMRRYVVVLSVSALDAFASDRFMENFTRHIKSHKLSDAEVELLQESGVTVDVALELLSDRTERPFRVIRSHVERHFSKHSCQSFDAINNLYKYLGLKHLVDDAMRNAEWKKLPSKISNMLKRRHTIVHEGDFDGKHNLRTIDRNEVERWLKAIQMLVESMDEIVSKCVKNNCSKQRIAKK